MIYLLQLVLLCVLLCTTAPNAFAAKANKNNRRELPCLDLLETGKPIQFEEEVLEVVDAEIANYLMGKPFTLTEVKEFSFEYGRKAQEVKALLTGYRERIRVEMKKKQPAPPLASLEVRELPRGVQEKLQYLLEPETEKPKPSKNKPPKRGLRPKFVAVAPQEHIRAAEELPVAVEKSVQAWVIYERGYELSATELSAFAAWFFIDALPNSKPREVEWMTSLREVLFGYALPTKPNDDLVVRQNANFILAAKRICFGAQAGVHTSAIDAIENLEKFANRTPMEIHSYLMQRDWNVPLVDTYRRLIYLYYDSTFEYAAVIRLDQPWDRTHGVHLHKEVVDINVLLRQDFRRPLTYDPRTTGAKIYTDAGLLSDHIVHIPVAAEMFPENLDPFRRRRNSPVITSRLRRYFFPDILKAIGYQWGEE